MTFNNSAKEFILWNAALYDQATLFVKSAICRKNLVLVSINLQLRLMQGVVSNANDVNLFLMIFPIMSHHCKLVPVQYREYKSVELISNFC